MEPGLQRILEGTVGAEWGTPEKVGQGWEGHRVWEENLGQSMRLSWSDLHLPTPWKASVKKEAWYSGEQVQGGDDGPGE